ncbi:MAG: hypothetical protein II038_09510 [Lachnospiraceae bacterium]|nr:hypothetical protein [Lachnospiraceae bacterium]
MNDFVAYLNSVNNIGGNSSGSLAETQVKSKYFDMVKIDRKLGEFISKSVSEKDYKSFILTGHAGDGKTSILVQVLKKLGYLGEQEGLEEEKEYADFYYAKDMSELPEDRQEAVLMKALSSPKNGKSSLLISNTGPLLHAFMMLEKKRKGEIGEAFTEEDQINLQSTLLSQLDRNEDKIISIAEYEFLLINIARVDNVGFSTSVLRKILDDALWTSCTSCQCADRCPILNNKRILSAQFDRVAAFVENFYRFLYENDKRMTIRQIVGQISYAITGNLSCADIKDKFLKEPFFNYNFANLFFGFYGIDEKAEASQIKGIKQIRVLELDRIALDVDYRLFVNNDYSCFLPNIQNELSGLNGKYRKHYQLASEDQFVSSSERKAETKLRRAVRRFYLVFSLCETQEDLNNIFNQIFGASYSEYCRMIGGKQPKAVLRKLQTTVFQALYVKNTGSVPDGQNELPLTLRREDDVFQNVMLVLGEVSKSDLQIVQCPVNNRFEDYGDKQIVFLKLRDDMFRLSLPMVNYFQNLISGAIASNNNPALTHGIATLDALLLDNFGDAAPESKDDCEMRVMINTTTGQEFETFSFSDNRLNVW